MSTTSGRPNRATFGKAIWDVVGERRNPRIVFEHPGEHTIPTSVFVCDTGGMIVICAGTTGYNAVADLRYLWMRQKRLQGSHFANDEQSYAFNQLVVEGKIDPCLAKTFRFDQIAECHQIMHENRAPEGKMVALVGAPKAGMKDLKTLSITLSLATTEDLNRPRMTSSAFCSLTTNVGERPRLRRLPL